MPVTTTDNPTTSQLRHLLQDYEIHLTGAENSIPAPLTPRAPISVESPADWPRNHRRVPPYRPIDKNLDREQRPDGTNPIERAFIFTMLHGVWLNASMAKAWRNSGGRISSNLFRYKIGGEW